MRPRDEALEAFDRGRRRRDEARHFFGRQHRHQRGRVFLAQLAEREGRTRHHRKRLLPVGRGSRCRCRSNHRRSPLQFGLERHLLHYCCPPSEPGAGSTISSTGNNASNRSGLNESTSAVSSPNTTSASPAELPHEMSSSPTLLPHTMLSSRQLPQTMLSMPSALPQTTLSSEVLPQTTLSQSAPPQS